MLAGRPATTSRADKEVAEEDPLRPVAVRRRSGPMRQLPVCPRGVTVIQSDAVELWVPLRPSSTDDKAGVHLSAGNPLESVSPMCKAVTADFFSFTVDRGHRRASSHV